MKKLIVAIAAVASLSAFGQGTIGFGNSGVTPVQVNGVNAVAANSARAALYYAANTTPIATLIADSGNFLGLGGTAWSAALGGVSTVGVPIGGIFTKSTRTTGNEIGGGTSVYVQVRAWDGGYADWASAVTAWGGGATVHFGWSTYNLATSAYVNPWLNGTGSPNGTPPTAAIDLLLGTGGFTGLNLLTVQAVPEPSAMALAGLAAASLLIFRRRK